MTCEVELSSGENVMRDARNTTKAYLIDAESDINDMFGKGFAEEHPELVGAYIQAATQVEASSMQKMALQDIRDALGEHSKVVASAAERIAEGLQPFDFEDVSGALTSIASSINSLAESTQNIAAMIDLVGGKP